MFKHMAHATLAQCEELKKHEMLTRHEAQRVHVIEALHESRQTYSHTLAKRTTNEVSSEAHAPRTKYVAHAQVLKTRTKKIPYFARIPTLKTSVGESKAEACANKRKPYVPAIELETHALRRVVCPIGEEPEAHVFKRMARLNTSEPKALTHKCVARSIDSKLEARACRAWIDLLMKSLKLAPIGVWLAILMKKIEAHTHRRVARLSDMVSKVRIRYE